MTSAMLRSDCRVAATRCHGFPRGGCAAAYLAAVDHPPIAVDVHESEPYSWTMAHRAAHGRLLDHVVGYSGYVERSVLPLRRREVANDSLVVIISFGEPIDVQLSTELVADMG